MSRAYKDKIKCIVLRVAIYTIYISMGCLVTLSFKDGPKNFLDSLLFIFVTISTIGYGNLKPDTDASKLLMVLFVLLGTIFGDQLGKLVDFLKEKLEEHLLKAMKTTDERQKIQWKYFFAACWIFLVLAIGIGGIWGLEATTMEHNLVNVIYFSVISSFTIGYGDFSFTTTSGKVFALFWIPLGTLIVSRALSYLQAHSCGCICKKEETKPRVQAAKPSIVSNCQFEKDSHVTPPDRILIDEHQNIDAVAALKYLTGILSSSVYEFATKSQLQLAENLSKILSSTLEPDLQITIWLKREDLQPIGSSYKLRGVYNMMANVPKEKLKKGVTSAFGNHAEIVAHVAHQLDFEAMIVLPECKPEHGNEHEHERQDSKLVESLHKFHTNVTRNGKSIRESEDFAKKVAEDQRITYIPPCDHPDMITGYGTIGMEIINELIQNKQISNLHAIFVPVGDGNLIAGIASYVKRTFPKVQIVGVEECSESVMAWSFKNGERVMLENLEGKTVDAIDQECFSICFELIDSVIVVDNGAINRARERMIQETGKHSLTPAGVLSVAGVDSYCTKYRTQLHQKHIVAVISEGEEE